MQLDPDTLIHDLGQDYAKARRLFRRLGMDLNAYGVVTISEACGLAGISFKDFSRSMEAMTPERASVPTPEDWAEAPLNQLVEHIQVRHHAYTRSELARLARVMEELMPTLGADYPELAQIRVHFAALKDDLLRHLDSEDQHIFPAILRGDRQGGTLEDLQLLALKEHEAAEELFQNIGVLTRNFSLPQGAPAPLRALYLGLRDLEEDLFVHIYLENHVLFPRAVHESPAST